MTAPELDTARLREIAEAATQGRWRVSKDRPASVWADRDAAGWDAFHIAQCSDAVGTVDPADLNAEHIAAFDPPTVLALLDRLAALTVERDAAVRQARTLLRTAQLAADNMDRSRRKADAAKRAHADLVAAVKAALNSEDAKAVLYGVTGTHPESYGGVTKDEALECAGELLTRLSAVLADHTSAHDDIRHDRGCAAGITNGAARCQCAHDDGGEDRG